MTGRRVCRPWSDAEQAYLIEHWQTMSDADIGQALNRSPTAIAKKRNKLKLVRPDILPRGIGWSDKETAYLQSHADESLAQLSRDLHRSKESIHSKLVRLGLIERSDRRKWSEEEVSYLYRNYGSMSAERIGRKLHRSSVAVRHKAESFGLVMYTENWTLKLLCLAFQLDPRAIHRWHKKFGMPLKQVKHGKKVSYQIKEDDFWNWAVSQKKGTIPWKKYQKGFLTGEPKEIRMLIQSDPTPDNHRKLATLSEVKRMSQKHNEGFTYAEIAEKAGRTREAVAHLVRAERKREQENAY